MSELTTTQVSPEAICQRHVSPRATARPAHRPAAPVHLATCKLRKHALHVRASAGRGRIGSQTPNAPEEMPAPASSALPSEGRLPSEGSLPRTSSIARAHA
eukprot:5147624-Prymnesium_polylepis.1